MIASWISFLPACDNPTPTETNPQDAGSVPTLSADGYTTVSDVTIHNKVAMDIGEIHTLLGTSPIDWKAVQVMYEKGKHSVKADGSIRTLNGFASAPNNFKTYSPSAVAYFKDKGICQLAPVDGFKCTEGKFVDEFVEFYAINGTGPFKDASDNIRVAAVKAGLPVLMSYWVRLEFGKALGKAKDGDYEPLNGAPHNWDEAFAFYWGPEGKHSLYQLAANLSDKYKLASSINKDFFAALIDGLKQLIDGKSEPTSAIDAGQKQLLRLFILACLDAAKDVENGASDDDKAAARWKGFAYWMAIGDAIHQADASAATTFQDVFFTKKIEKDVFAALQDAVKKTLSGLGFKEADFGDALQ
jgi:hypothetical protein